MRGLTRGRRSVAEGGGVAVFAAAPRPGATCRSARFLAHRPAGCFSFVDSRLCAVPGATCRSARFLARRPAGCFSFVD
eukprot:tig00020830_g14403.t1